MTFTEADLLLSAGASPTPFIRRYPSEMVSMQHHDNITRSHIRYSTRNVFMRARDDYLACCR